jgi:hypothetical protein
VKIELERMISEEGPPVHVERDWPAVPRVGEYVEIVVDGGTVAGTVRVVMWDDDGVPQVRFR